VIRAAGWHTSVRQLRALSSFIRLLVPVYTVKPATCRYIHGRDSRYAQNVPLHMGVVDLFYFRQSKHRGTTGSRREAHLLSRECATSRYFWGVICHQLDSTSRSWLKFLRSPVPKIGCDTNICKTIGDYRPLKVIGMIPFYRKTLSIVRRYAYFTSFKN